jgi:NTP pyrophosphatase (non-canonical NTP hydrolase)
MSTDYNNCASFDPFTYKTTTTMKQEELFPLTFDYYEERVVATRSRFADSGYALFGLLGEAGKLATQVAKAIRDNPTEDLDVYEMRKTLGKILWFVTAVAKDQHLTLEEVAQFNLDRLEQKKKTHAPTQKT